MKMRTIVLLGALVGSLAVPVIADPVEVSKPLSQQEIDAAYKQAKKETGLVIGAIISGGLSGGLLALLAGAAVAVPVAINIKDPQWRNFAITMSLLSSLPASVIGSIAAVKLVSRYYANKYGVNRRIAQAALMTTQPLSLAIVKNLFIAAESHDTDHLRQYLQDYFTIILHRKLTSSLADDNQTASFIYIVRALYRKENLAFPEDPRVITAFAQQFLIELFNK